MGPANRVVEREELAVKIESRSWIVIGGCSARSCGAALLLCCFRLRHLQIPTDFSG